MLDTQTVNYGEAATAPADPTREGYTFTDWDKAFDNVTADMTVTAQYTINTYTVTFVDGFTGGTISTATVNHGDTAALPKPPDHSGDGYYFVDWEGDNTNVTSNRTVTAKYDKINKYTVTFVDGVTDEKLNTQMVEHGGSAVAPEVPKQATPSQAGTMPLTK